MDFLSTYVYVSIVKKADNGANFAAGGVSNRRTHHNLLCRDKYKHRATGYAVVYEAVSYMTLPGMRSYINFLK
jgi:hypothetical protein